MALSEEAIRLVFDLSKSATDVEDLTQKIAKLGVETERAAKIAEQAWEKEARARKESNVEAMKGQQAIEATRRQLTAQEAELRALEAAWKKNTLEAGEYLAKQSELQAEISQTTNVLMRMKGTGAGGAQGQGIMAMSYAFQDFTSQVRNGFGPALASIQNNIPGMLMGTGLSNPAIAAISAISVGIGLIAPAIIKAFGPDSQEHIDKATEKIKEFTDEIETAHKAFIGMTEKPTTPEEEYAANIKAIFETRGTGDIVKTAIGKQFSGAEIEQALRGTMTEAQFAGRIGHVGMSDAEIEKMVHEKAMRVDPKTGAMTRGTLEEERGFREQLLQQQAEERVMRSKLATVAMSGAVIAGPKGERGRAILGRAMDELPVGLQRELIGVRPDVMKASDERDQAFNEGIERAIEAGPRRRNRAKNLKDAQNEAAQWHERFAREKQTEDDRIDAVVEQGEAGLERIGHGAKFRRGQRGFAAQKRQEAAATRAAKHAMQQEHQGWEQHNADVERESGRAADAMVDMAQAHGESREVVANLRRIAEVAKQEAADTRRMFSRMMKAEEETAFGGGPH